MKHILHQSGNNLYQVVEKCKMYKKKLYKQRDVQICYALFHSTPLLCCHCELSVGSINMGK